MQTPPSLAQNWISATRAYGERRVLLVFLLGFSSGLPLLLTFSTLTYWLSTLGIKKSTIGLFALAGLPFAFKYLWSPLVDRMPLPWFCAKFGQRRGWALFSQSLLIIAILVMGNTDPNTHIEITAICAIFVAFCAATQDIVIDALRIEMLDDAQQGAGAAMIVTGYRIGMLVAGGGALALSDYLSWPVVFFIVACFMSIGMIAVLLCREPDTAHASKGIGDKLSRWLPKQRKGRTNKFITWVAMAVIAPFVSFFMDRKIWVTLCILLFVVLYKFGDAFMGIMAYPFYRELGFSGTEIGAVTKLWGLLATLIGGLIGGIYVARYHIFWALLVAGLLQAVTNLIFAWLAGIGPSFYGLFVAISADNFTGGMGTAIFVAYLSQ
ncbi:MAG: MFS transporter, partial [Pseudomonadota bacterium]